MNDVKEKIIEIEQELSEIREYVVKLHSENKELRTMIKKIYKHHYDKYRRNKHRDDTRKD